VVTGGLLLAAAHRLSQVHGRWVLAFAGAVSTGWGILLAMIGPDATDEPRATAAWLVVYAALFGTTLLVLGLQLRRHRHRSRELAAHG
jgi:peptidoglycan/LPS O-acetylase OafA/YrhL